MKKTLTVNLGGTVFHIDEDAYQLLDKYLSNLRIHFRKEEGSEEIMNDFEMRISELFGERVRLGHEVITIEHVEEVINRMGKPEEIFEEETEEEKENAKKRTYQEQVITGKKKLMRDPDNRVIGGVAAGIAAYMGWDATAVRLAMILLLFIPVVHWMAILYIVLWMVMPLARIKVAFIACITPFVPIVQPSERGNPSMLHEREPFRFPFHCSVRRCWGRWAL